MIFTQTFQKLLEQDFILTNYETDRPLPRGKDKKVIALMKDELGWKIMLEFTALISKTYSYLIDDSDENKKVNSKKSKALNLKIIKII